MEKQNRFASRMRTPGLIICLQRFEQNICGGKSFVRRPDREIFRDVLQRELRTVRVTLGEDADSLEFVGIRKREN